MNRFRSIVRALRSYGIARPIMLNGELVTAIGEPAGWQFFDPDNDR